MAVLYVDEYGSKLRITDGLLMVEVDEEVVTSLRIQELEYVVIQQNCSITSAALTAMLLNGVETAFIDHRGGCLGRLEPALGKNLSLRKKQYRLSDDSLFSARIARNLVGAKITNMRTILMRYARSRPEQVNACFDHLKRLADAAKSAGNLGELMGIEGTASREYFEALGSIINTPFEFNGRNRRPPKDPVNAMLGFSYALLQNLVDVGVAQTGLDPFCGFLHRDHYGRVSLVLDLMEELRPVVADSVVLNICSRRLLDPQEDFEERDGGVLLNKAGRKKFFKYFHTRSEEFIKPDFSQNPVTYRKLCAIQARKFAACIRDERPDYKPFIVK